jgi:integrase
MDRRALPLPPDRLAELREYAENPKERLPIDIIPGTGLSLQEFLHLRPSWIEWPTDYEGPDVPLLRIPEEAPCARTLRQPKYQTVLTLEERDLPCEDCTRQPGPSKFFVEYDRRVRQIPVVDSVAADTLRWWFSRYDCIPLGRDLKGVETLCRRLDIPPSSASAQDLRWTYARRLADMEFDRAEIADVMGVQATATTFYRALRASKTDYDLQEFHSVAEYLDAIGEPGDIATSQEIADRLGIRRTAVTKRLRNLVDEEDRVEILKSGRRGMGKMNRYRRIKP